MKFSCAAQNSAFKNHPRDILRDENHFYGIVLVHIYIYKAEKPSVRLQFRWRPMIFLPADAHIEAFFVPN